jgi:hypothetical protein
VTARSVPARAVADLLAAIAEVLDVPQPAAVDDWEIKQARVLRTRAAQLCGALGFITENGVTERALQAAARIQREHAAQPLPYEPERDGAQ